MFSKLARKIDAEEIVRVNLGLCQHRVHSLVKFRFCPCTQAGGLMPAWQQRTSPPDSTQKVRRSTSRGPVPSTSSPRTEGRPRPATYHSASSSRRRSSVCGGQTLEPSLSTPFPVPVGGEPWQRQRHPSFPGLPTKMELRPQAAY
jgi:hypothetical protein